MTNFLVNITPATHNNTNKHEQHNPITTQQDSIRHRMHKAVLRRLYRIRTQETFRAHRARYTPNDFRDD